MQKPTSVAIGSDGLSVNWDSSVDLVVYHVLELGLSVRIHRLSMRCSIVKFC